MAKKIKGKDFFDASVLKTIDAVIKRLDKAEGEYEKLQKELEKNKASLKSYTQTNSKLAKTAQKTNAAMKEATRISRAQQQANAKSAMAESKQAKQLEKTKQEIREKNRRVKESIELGNRHRMNVTAQNSSLVQLEKALNMNRRAYANMTASERANAKQGGRLNAVIKQQAASVDRLRTSMGQAQQRVGGYREAIKNAQMRMMGFVMAATAMIRGVSRVIGSFVEFNLATAKVKAMSGEGQQKMKMLSDQAKELGISTEKSAGQVAKLQLELSKKGFSADQINASTAAIVDLSIASGEELAPAAEIASGVMNAFGMTAEQMPRIVDVMAKSFSSSALDLNKFQEGMGKAAPIAKQFGWTIEQTTARISVLADANVKAGSASTHLRRILTDINATGRDYDDVMAELAGSSDKITKATELFGRRAASTAVILAENIEKADMLTESYNGASGSAKEMANIMKDTLSGDIKAAKSAVEGFSIELGESNNSGLRGIIQGFTKAVRWLADNLKAIGDTFKTVGAAVAGYIAYQQAAALATGKTTKAVGMLSKAYRTLRSTAGLVSIAVGAIALIFMKMRERAKEYREEQEAIEKSSKSLKRAMASAQTQFQDEARSMNDLINRYKNLNPKTEEAAKLRKKINTEYGKYLPSLLTEKTRLSDINTIQKQANKTLMRNIFLKSRQEELEKQLEPIQKRLGAEIQATQDMMVDMFGMTQSEAMGKIQPYIDEAMNAISQGFDAMPVTTYSDVYKETGGAINTIIGIINELGNVSQDVKNRYGAFISGVESGNEVIEDIPEPDGDTIEAWENVDKIITDSADSINKLNAEIADMDLAPDDEELTYWEKILKLQKELREAIKKTNEEKDQGALLEFWNKYGAEGMNTINRLADVQRASYNRRMEEHQADLNAIQQEYEAKINAAEGNSQLQNQLREQQRQAEKEVQQEILAEKQKQAKIEKQLAAFEAAVNGAVAVINALKEGSVPLAMLIGAGVAAQIAAIEAQPIPQFYKGTDNHPGGASLVGERGKEMYMTPSGMAGITPDTSTVMDFPKGTQIFDNDDTKRYLAGAAQEKKHDIQVGEKDYSNYFKKLIRNTGKGTNVNVSTGNSEYKKRYVN